MALWNFKVPNIEYDKINDKKYATKMANYLMMLEEGLRYSFGNIDDENISKKFIDDLTVRHLNITNGDNSIIGSPDTGLQMLKGQKKIINFDIVTGTAEFGVDSVFNGAIKAKQLVFGGDNGSISYNNLSDKPSIPPPYTDAQSLAAWKASGYSTYIDQYGVYTGNIVANQITAGTISGDRINGGTIIGASINGPEAMFTTVHIRGTSSNTYIYPYGIEVDGKDVIHAGNLVTECQIYNLKVPKAVQADNASSSGGVNSGGNLGLFYISPGGGYISYQGYPKDNSSGYVYIGSQTVQARYIEPISLREAKRDIIPFGDGALELIRKTPIRRYSFKDSMPNEKTHIGVIVDEAPEEIIGQGGKTISLYDMISIAWKAIQELDAKVKDR